MKAAKTDIEKRKAEDAELRSARRGRLVIMAFAVAGIMVLTFLFFYGKNVSAAIVPADEPIWYTTGTEINYTQAAFGHVTNALGGQDKVAQAISIQTFDRAVCAVDVKIANTGLPASPSLNSANLWITQNDPDNSNTVNGVPAIDLADLEMGFSLTSSTFVFDPCVTLAQDKAYFVVLSVGPLLTPYNNQVSPGALTAYTSGTQGLYGDVYGWHDLGTPTNPVALNLYVYGYNSLAGYPEPVSSDYNFSTGTALGTDLGTSGNFISAALKYLFIPSSKAMDGYKAYHDLLLQKAPLGYYPLAENAFFTFINTSATQFASIEIPTSSLEIMYLTVSSSVLPFLTTPASSTFVFWNVSSTKNSVIVSRTLPYLLTFERWGIWIGFLWYLFVRIRDLILG